MYIVSKFINMIDSDIYIIRLIAYRVKIRKITFLILKITNSRLTTDYIYIRGILCKLTVGFIRNQTKILMMM